MFTVLPLQGQLKTSVINRVIAKVIDLAIVVLVAAILPRPLGPLLGFAYSVLGDGINYKNLHGQSIGKKLMGLQVVDRVSRKPVEWRSSLYRNAPVGVATFFAIIPLWGWLILGLIGIPLMAMEIYLMMSVETGHRLGDVMGDTEVVEIARIESRP